MSTDTKQQEAAPIAWSWLKSISRDLYALDDAPLLGSSPDFPWEKLAQEFAKIFSLESFKISPGELIWKEKAAVLAGVGLPALCTEISATGMDGTATFWMCREDVDHLMAKVLQISEVVSELQSDEVVSNFHRFLGIEIVCLLNQLGFDPRISFKITSFDEKTPPDAALCQDIKIQLGNEQCLARLTISNEFRKSWRTFFLKPITINDGSSKLDQVETTIRLEAARTIIPLEDLMKIHAGDFLLLDQIYYAQSSDKNDIFISLNGKQLFRAHLDAGKLKILEIPNQSEAHIPMVEKSTPSDLGSVEQTPPPEHDEENPFPEEEENENEGMELVEAVKNTSSAQSPKPNSKPAGISVDTQNTQTSKELTANDIPIQLIIEVASITLSVQKLLELTPGNLLDLNINPESGVNLVVNNRIIGRGELLKIGDQIGVRILQIGV